MNRKWMFPVVAVFAILVTGCATTGGSSDIPKGFITKTMDVGGVSRAYVVYVPEDYTPAKEWPLVVFLHGMGERGSDGLIQSEVGIGTAIRRHEDWFPCIVVMPQCPKDKIWTSAFDHIDAAIQYAKADYRIDESQILLTGLSMGGFGTWAYGALHADTLAALMPVCGGGQEEDAPALAKVPIWAFHGAVDSVVSADESRSMVEAVKAAGGEVRYTEYPEVDHNSWDRAYGDADAIAWLLAQQK
ncbi:MAG: dienelactone hydrolase family protein [Candidatus Hydrogenedentes bacterium]|nr:dienelactone hydrolase family protein [Candidatus Hydrogenedentota bacterium]